MLPPALSLSSSAARRFVRRAVGLDTPHADIATALAYHGYVQIDPINVCGRMHDLILRNRVAGYREGDLMRYLHGHDTPLPAAQRTAFEHHLPSSGILVAFPLEAWPHLLAAMRARTRRAGAWSGRLSPRERELAARLLTEIGERGPLGSDAIVDERRARRVWGAATLVKSTLQKLFFHGRVLIAQRDNGRRLYDLPERILPASVLAAREPAPADTARWEALLKLRQRRLVPLKRTELALVEDVVQPVKLTDVACPTLYCLRHDTPLLAEIISSTASSPTPQDSHQAERFAGEIENAMLPLLLAPLDPLLYDRRVTSALWAFDYTWEVYTPAAKRVRGYYALPILAGTEIVGHVDPKADRERRKLVVVSRSLRRGHKAASAVRALARWLGLR